MSGKYKVYPEYRESGVEWLGEVPNHWPLCPIKFVGLINPSKSEVTQLPKNTSTSFLPMESIGEQGELDLSNQRPISEVASGYTYIGEGDVCIAKITPCFENGKGALASGLKNNIGFATTEIIPIRCNTRSLSLIHI